MNRDILDRIAQIDWTIIGSPHIPQWMQELMSNDSKLRSRAYNEMVVRHLAPPDCIECLANCTQEEIMDTVRRDSAFVLVPFLIEFLRDENIRGENKEFILAILAALLEWVRAEACLSDEMLKFYGFYIRRIYDTIAKGANIYNQLTSSEAAGVREEAYAVIELLEIYYRSQAS